MSSGKDKPNILIPIIRKLMPNIIAQDIAGVQSMTNNVGAVFNTKTQLVPTFKTFSSSERNGSTWYHVRAYQISVMEWIREQPTDLWQEDEHDGVSGIQFHLHEKLYTAFSLRWTE